MLPPEEEVEGAKGFGTTFNFGFLKLTLEAVARELAFLFFPPCSTLACWALAGWA